MSDVSGQALPVVAITAGDPGGVGPEIVARALARPDVQAACRPVVVGDPSLLNAAAAVTRSVTRFHPVQAGDILPSDLAGVPVIEIPEFVGREFVKGAVAAANGAAAHAWIVHAAQLALDRKVDAICTAPISKEAMFTAGFRFPGHTELLAELCGGSEVRMMLEGGGLHVVLQTIHVAISRVPGLLTREALGRTLDLCRDWTATYLAPGARIAVCGLNPHASEGGHFGDEEARVIAPAIEAARARGVAASGPYPADTVFHRALRGDFDLVVAMYHDQALIPVKTLAFDTGVNVTLGLPILRTSPDHGTAFDIAGRGVARESSMVSAILRAAELASRRRVAGK